MSHNWLSRSALGLAVVVAGVGAVPGRALADPPATTVAYVLDNVLYLGAGRGVANSVAMIAYTGGQVLVAENAARLTLNPAHTGGCRQSDPWSVLCPGTLTNVTVRLGDGADRFDNYTGMSAVVHGEGGGDLLWGWTGTDVFHGGDGDDELYGKEGADTLNGNAGADRIEGHAGADTLTGGDGDDVLRGNEDGDVLYGEGGRNDVFGGPGRDTLYSSGQDQVRGDEDDDTLALWYQVGTSDFFGGPGTDTMVYAGASNNRGYQVSLNDVADDGARYQLFIPHNVHSDVEHIVGSRYDDRIIGSDAANTIDAGEGNDTVDGRGGDDVLDAQQGTAQSVSGGAGFDRCAGDGLIADATCERVGSR